MSGRRNFEVFFFSHSHEIQLLEGENKELQTWLALITSDQNRKKDMKAIGTLKQILSCHDALKNQIDEVKRYSERLDADVSFDIPDCFY